MIGYQEDLSILRALKVVDKYTNRFSHIETHEFGYITNI